MKTEYRTYTIEPDQRNPYAQESEWMYYPTEQGVQHDADQDGEDLVYCGNCKWADTLEEAQSEIDDLIIEEQENEIEKLKEMNLKIQDLRTQLSVMTSICIMWADTQTQEIKFEIAKAEALLTK